MLLYSSQHAYDAGLAAVKAGVLRKALGSVVCRKEDSSDERERLLEHSNEEHFSSWLYSWTYLEQ